MATSLKRTLVIVCTGLMVPSSITSGQVAIFTERQSWEETVRHFQTIPFTGFPSNTNAAALYEQTHGVVFSDGWDLISSGSGYVNDRFGLRGMGSIAIAFEGPHYWLAADYPGALTIRLFSNGELFFESSAFDIAGVGFFGGVVSEQPFDAVVIDRPWDGFHTTIDDLHFGTACPLATHDQPGLSPCPADVDLDGVIGVDDLVAVLVSWGACPGDAPCVADTDQSCTVDVNDLLEVITSWGECSGER